MQALKVTQDNRYEVVKAYNANRLPHHRIDKNNQKFIDMYDGYYIITEPNFPAVLMESGRFHKLYKFTEEENSMELIGGFVFRPIEVTITREEYKKNYRNTTEMVGK